MILWNLLISEQLDLRFSPSRGLTVRIVERPGQWMAPDELTTLIDECRDVATACLEGETLDYGILVPGSDAARRTIITMIYDNEGRPIAFNALPLIPATLGGERLEVLHLGLVMVHPSARSSGLSWILYGLTCFLLFVRRQLRPLWISSVTQVPAVVGMVCESFDGVWPGAPDARATFAHHYLGRHIALNHRIVFGVGPDAGFDDTRSVFTNAYTGGSDNLKKTFDVATKHRNEAYNAWCARELDYGRGDDVLQLGQLNLASARGFLLKSTPRHALPQLAVQVLLLGVQSVVAPLAQWLAGNRSLGRLRPFRQAKP
ncbi:hypothetical protein ABI_23920 [Asticcacaulis biprosthecium C19]|uniref:N-acetyltransferase domain-containing protein n=1 Tax=Asticcacaulis biprosthecium C19 TaxID=715226 RepID=F4QNS1_9CAUL|nr:hypothetical protein [Asticcacaulis biprosthecium]EGF90979.1 hypothetical protein ABI_23920 [Asticcacaulis biprosthecium C19]